MGMFQKPKPKPTEVPKDAKVSFAVKYKGGRKPFDNLPDAMAFAGTQRDQVDGWAEVTRVVETIESPR
jgi:hypothetical protein